MIDPATMLRLDGKAALVTGGTRGIGRAVAEALLRAGASLCVTARKDKELEETVEALAPLGPVVSVQAAAGEPDAAETAVTRCLEAFGRLDVLVNNAGTNPQYGPLVEADLRAVEKVWQVNVHGPLHHAQSAWRHWMRDHGGTVVNVASIGGLRVSPMIGAYNVSKAALVHLTRQLAGEMAPGVRVNAVAPAVIRTRFSVALYEGAEDAVVTQYPLGRLGDPDDVANAVLFLASDASSWITGEVLVLDGGASVDLSSAFIQPAEEAASRQGGGRGHG